MKFNQIRWIISGTVIGIINGLFGGGGGMLAVPLLKRLGDMTEKSAHATALAVILPISIVSGFVYAKNGSSELATLLPLCIGSTAGGVVGAVLLKKIKSEVVELIFSWIMLIAGVKMLLG